jgi:hypothetical protein
MLGDSTYPGQTKQGSSMYSSDPIPSMPNVSQDISSGSKVPLRLLPPGAKVGDKVELTVQRIDADGDVAYLSSGEAQTGSKEGSDQDQNGTGTEKAGTPQTSGLNTGMLLGPMSGLKGYLARKSVEVQSQI